MITMSLKNSHGVSSEGAALSMLCGASLGFGYNLLRFDGSTMKEKDNGTNNALVKSSLRAVVGGALFNLGLYLVVPSWVRAFWLYDGN